MREFIEETIGTYNKIAPIYFSRWDRLTKKELYYLDLFLSLLRGKLILDAGCGTGKDGVYFRKRGYEVVGIDLSEKMLNYAAKRITVIKGDFRNLPFRDSAFDGIWSNSSLVHTKDKQSVIKEWERVLKEGGILGIVIQNKIFPKYLFRQIQTAIHKGKFEFGYANYDGRHWWYINQKELLSLVKGFRVLYYTKDPFERWLRVYAKKEKT